MKTRLQSIRRWPWSTRGSTGASTTPLVFDATPAGRRVPPSVSRIQLGRSGAPGKPIRLRPLISDIRPADGATVTGPTVRLTARITDRLSGVDPRRVRVEVDGERVRADFDPDTGRLITPLRLPPGRHESWIGALNRAYAPAQTMIGVTVR